MKAFQSNLLVRFSIVSFVVMVAIAAVLAVVLAEKIRDDAVEDLVEEAVGTSKRRLLANITPEDLETPMVGQRYDDFDRFVQQSIVSARTARVTLWSKDGTVIYSVDPSQVGEKYPAKKKSPYCVDRRKRGGDQDAQRPRKPAGSGIGKPDGGLHPHRV